MLSLRTTKFISLTTIPSRICITSRYLSTTVNLRSYKSNDHKMKHPDAENIKEQKLFDNNKKRLEHLEHDKNSSDLKKPSMEELQKQGEDARIEQNRPDDGVY